MVHATHRQTVQTPERKWMVYFVMTMDTASFNTLSPKTSMLRVGSTSRAWKMARVATGSTAEMRLPKAKLGKGGGSIS